MCGLVGKLVLCRIHVCCFYHCIDHITLSVYLYGLGHGLAKHLRDAYLRTIATPRHRQETSLGWAPKILSACNGENNSSIAKPSERNAPSARGMPGVPGGEISEGFGALLRN